MQMNHDRAVKAIALALLAVSACKSNNNNGSAAPSNGSGAPAVGAAAPSPACPVGNALDAGKCVEAVTAEKVAAVDKQASRIDEMVTLLAKVDQLSAPIELLNGLRQQEAWTQLTKAYSGLATVNDIVGMLDTGVKELRALSTTLNTSKAALTDLKAQLNGLMTSPAVAKPLADVQALVSAKVEAAVAPLAAQIAKVGESVLSPALAKFNDIGDMVIGACAVGKATGGPALKDLCTKARDVFTTANAFLAEVKTKPVALFDQVANDLKSSLANLVTSEANQAISNAQKQLNALLKLPAAGGAAASGNAGSTGAQ